MLFQPENTKKGFIKDQNSLINTLLKKKNTDLLYLQVLKYF